MVCKKCGFKIHDNDNYCKRCGKNLNKFSALKKASLILGLSGLLISPYLAPIAFIFGILGFVFALVSMNKLKNMGGIILNLGLIVVAFLITYLQLYLLLTINFDIKDSKRIGNEYVGYINIPKNLNKVNTDNKNEIIYGDKDGSLISLYMIELPFISVKNYSENIKSKFENSNFSNINYETYFKDNYYINKISCYDNDNKLWIYNWVFKEKSGNLHHIEIKVSDLDYDLFDLVDTYNLKG